jgi:predicted nucleic acid-binding protein
VIVVADASPLILLAKVRRLELIRELWGRDIRVPVSVANEVLAVGADPVEVEVLEAFLRQCRVETVRQPRRFAVSMSQADNEALTLAARVGAGVLLCDDRLTRRMAEAEGIRPMGTLGVLLRAMQQRLIAPRDAQTLLDRLVESHDFRIGIGVYQAALRAISGAP